MVVLPDRAGTLGLDTPLALFPFMLLLLLLLLFVFRRLGAVGRDHEWRVPGEVVLAVRPADRGDGWGSGWKVSLLGVEDPNGREGQRLFVVRVGATRRNLAIANFRL